MVICLQGLSKQPQIADHNSSIDPSLSEYYGVKESDFNALHYTRLLADLAKIFRKQKGKLLLSQKNQKLYSTSGVVAFLPSMLNAAVRLFNWEYFDLCEAPPTLQSTGMFMLWRLSHHNDFNKMFDETLEAFPFLLHFNVPSHHPNAEKALKSVIKLRLMTRFLSYWGMAYFEGKKDSLLIHWKMIR